MSSTGGTTRLFSAIVGLGLAAAAAGCGGSDEVVIVPTDSATDSNKTDSATVDSNAPDTADAFADTNPADTGVAETTSDVVDEDFGFIPIK